MWRWGGMGMASLFELFFEEIGSLRKEMHDKGTQLHSLSDPAIVKLSTRLDDKLNRFHKLLRLSSATGAKQLFLAHEQSVRKHRDKLMPVEYDRMKTVVEVDGCSLPETSADSVIMEFITGLRDTHEPNDDHLLRKFVLTYEGKVLNEEEARSFIAFLRKCDVFTAGAEGSG
jgi:hypothetical protein